MMKKENQITATETRYIEAKRGTRFIGGTSQPAAGYEAPHIEIIDIEITQNILGGSAGSVPGFSPTDW